MAQTQRLCSPARLLTGAALGSLLWLAAACGSANGDADEGGGSPAPSQAAMTTESALPAPPARPPASAPASPVDEAPAPAAAPRAPAAGGAAGASGASAAGAGAAAAAAQGPAFSACTYSEGTYGRDCDSVFVTMKQSSPARCVQLTIDNCGDYGRQGIGGRLPMGWRLESGTVGSNLSECEPGVFYPSSTVAQRAEGTISWNETTRLPSDLVLDVTLQTSVVGAELASVDIATTAPIATTACER